MTTENKTLIGFVGLAVLAMIPLSLTVIYVISDGSWERAGQIGDACNIFTMLFSGCAFTGVLVSLYFQRTAIERGSHDAKIATQASAFKAVFDIVQDEEFREARVFILSRGTVVSGWAAKADEVCKGYNTVGIICQAEYVDEDLIIAVWGRSIRVCWDRVQNRVQHHRVHDDTFARGFEWLAHRAKAADGSTQTVDNSNLS